MVNLRDRIIICQTADTPLHVLAVRRGSATPAHDLTLELPQYWGWADLTYYQMRLYIEKGENYASQVTQGHNAQGPIPKPPKYFILDVQNPSNRLLAVTKMVLSMLNSPIPVMSGHIPAWPGKNFEVGTAAFNILLSQGENARFAELLAKHKATWGNQMLTSVTVSHGADRDGSPLPSFLWKGKPLNDPLRSRIENNLKASKDKYGSRPPPSPGHGNGPDKVLPPGQQGGSSGAAGNAGQGPQINTRFLSSLSLCRIWSSERSDNMPVQLPEAVKKVMVIMRWAGCMYFGRLTPASPDYLRKHGIARVSFG